MTGSLSALLKTAVMGMSEYPTAPLAPSVCMSYARTRYGDILSVGALGTNPCSERFGSIHADRERELERQSMAELATSPGGKS